MCSRRGMFRNFTVHVCKPCTLHCVTRFTCWMRSQMLPRDFTPALYCRICARQTSPWQDRSHGSNIMHLTLKSQLPSLCSPILSTSLILEPFVLNSTLCKTSNRCNSHQKNPTSLFYSGFTPIIAGLSLANILKIQSSAYMLGLPAEIDYLESYGLSSSVCPF